MLYTSNRMDQQSLELCPQDFCLPKNLRMLLIGGSGVGKSTYMLQMVKHRESIFAQHYSKILFCSPNLKEGMCAPRDQKFMTDMESFASPLPVVWFDHFITLEELMAETQYEESEDHNRVLLFVDDFPSEIYNSPVLVQLFTRLSSHGQIDACIAVHQSLGSREKYFNIVFQSANVITIFRSNSDRLSLAFLGRKLFPYAKQFLQGCMEKVGLICGAFTPLLIDCSLTNYKLNHLFSVRSGNIFPTNPEEYVPVLYFRNPYHNCE